MTRYLPYAILALMALAFVAVCANIDFIQDDAFITMAYARNLVHGDGLVFNIGEHVEGCTSLLWTLLAAGCHAVSDNPVPILCWLGILCGALTLLPVYRTARCLLTAAGTDDVWMGSFGAGMLALLAPLVLASTAAYQSWSVSAMEVSFFCLLVALAMDAYVRRPEGRAWWIWCCVALLARPEAMLLAGALGAWHAYRTRIWLPLLAMGGVLAALTLWRYLTFGALLPNTFAAKTGGMFDGIGPGVDYLWQYLDNVWLSGTMFVALAAGVFLARKRAPFLLPLFGLVLLWMVAVMFLGGDVLRHQRFMLPILTLTVTLLPVALASPDGIFKNDVIRYAVAAGLGVMVAAGAWFGEREAIAATQRIEGELTSKMRRTGEWLKTYAASQNRRISVAATTIGALKYYSDQTVIDMLGLTDRVVATQPDIIPEVSADATVQWKERKYNANYILQRKPDFILFSTGLKPSAYAERALWAREAWVEYYFYYYDIPGATTLQVMLRRKPQQVLERSPVHRIGLNHDQILAVLKYPEAVMKMNARGASPQADEIFRQIIARGPGNYSQPYQCIGDSKFSDNDLDSAYGYYHQALAIDPMDIRAHYGLFQIAHIRKDTATIDVHGDWIYRCNPVLFKALGLNVPPGLY